MANQYRRLQNMGGTPREVAEVVNNLVEGKINSTGDITLANAGATTTILKDKRIGPDSVILFEPVTVSAAATNKYPFGTFEHQVTQTFAAADTPYVLAIATTEYAYGMSLASNRITVDYAGVYSLYVSASFRNTDSQIHQAYIWTRVNGVDVPHSCIVFGVNDKQGYTQGVMNTSFNHPVELNAGDYVEVVCAVDSTVLSIVAAPAQTTPYVRPSIPSLTANLEMLEPSQTAGSAFELYVTNKVKGQATINHLPNDQSDATYRYVILG